MTNCHKNEELFRGYKSMRSKPIILLAGTAGTGKTTLARYLSCMYSFDQRLASGFTREILKCILPKESYPALHSLSFRPPSNANVIEHFIQQCKILAKPIESCINRAREEGTSLILEGSNLVPTLLNLELVDLFVILAIKEKTILRSNLEGESHIFRHITDIDFNNILRIQDFLLAESRRIESDRIFIVKNSNYDLARKIVIEKIPLIAKRS
jgi:2-phosphoglycerate kinase